MTDRPGPALGKLLSLAILLVTLLMLARAGATSAVAAPSAPQTFSSTAFAAPAGRPLAQTDFASLLIDPAGATAQRPGRGFGDRQNSYPWAMKWWDGHLYVGTSRSFRCAELASILRAAIAILPEGTPIEAILALIPEGLRYPGIDPEISCPADYLDMPLRAEIWRYSPTADSWERVYQSPEVINPLDPTRLIATDIGYRNMTIFTEPDGTEAMYVSGVSARAIYHVRNGEQEIMPPPRLLRSTDGVTWEAVPQDPGTVLGDTQVESMRGAISHNGKFYIVLGGFYGSGTVFESDDPSLGNDNFTPIPVILDPTTGLETRTFELASFDGELYFGTRDLNNNAYSVVKVDPAVQPYSFEVIVPPGAGRSGQVSDSVISMYVFKDKLYVGTDKISGITVDPTQMIGAEMIRINPDDSWELVMGASRTVGGQLMEPLSGIDSGFGWPWNVHVWRMEEFDGNLYIGTADASVQLRNEASPPPAQQYGFDLWVTPNGEDFTLVSDDGFDEQFDFGIRNLAASPDHLYFGTANYYHGLDVYQGRAGFALYFPTVLAGN